MKNFCKTTAWLIITLMCCMVLFAVASPVVADPYTMIALMPDELAVIAPAIGVAGLVVNATNLKAVFTGFKTAFQNSFNGAETQYQKIATEVPSSTGEEEYGWFGQIPRLREWIGDRVVKRLGLHKYSIKNKKFESTIGVDKDKIDDDSYGLFTPLFSEMGYAAATHPDELVFALLKDGFTNPCYDGQYFFDTDHPVGNEETGITSVSNMQAGAGNAWFLMDNSRPLKSIIFQKRRAYDFKSMTKDDDESVFMREEFRYGVDARVNAGYAFWQMSFGSKATLDQANFDAAFEAMTSFKSDEGRPLGIMPKLLVVGSSNRSAAKAVVEKELLANGESNTNYKAVEVLVVPWLD